jgi:hypothetical protein
MDARKLLFGALLAGGFTAERDAGDCFDTPFGQVCLDGGNIGP